MNKKEKLASKIIKLKKLMEDSKVSFQKLENQEDKVEKKDLKEEKK